MRKNEGFWQQVGPFLAFGTALAAMLGSLYYSEIAGFVPCTLCWYQRILMYPLTLILLVGLIKQDHNVPDYVLPFSVLGMVVSTYHYLIQVGVIAHSGACQVGIPCDLRWVNYFGFVTIPFLSLTASTIITTLMALVKWTGRHSDALDPGLEN